MARFDRMSHPKTEVAFVATSPTDSFDRQIPGCFEVREDALDGAFGDSHSLRNVSLPQLGISVELEQHMPVVGEEGPFLAHRAVLSTSADAGPAVVRRL